MLPTRDPLQIKRHIHRLGWKEVCHPNENEKKSGVALFISDKIDFKTKTNKWQRRTLHKDKGIYQRRRYNNCKYLCTQHRSTSIHKTNATAIKGEIDSNTNIVGEFNTPLWPMERSSKMKINKETQALNDTLEQVNLIDNYRTIHPKAAEYTFFSRAHGIFSRIDHMVVHKTSLCRFKKTEIISSIFSHHNIMRLEINCKKKTK